MNNSTSIAIRYRLSKIVRAARVKYYHIKGYSNISENTILESNLRLDKLNRKGIHIGSNCLIASGTTILSHEHIFVKKDGSFYMKDTYIGNNCFIGVNSLICPGVHIGDQCVVGGGSVVTKDVPSNCMVAGVPARIIKKGITMDDKAMLTGEYRYKD